MKKTDCNEKILAVNDAVELLGGKWKLFILQVLTFHGTLRFKDLLEHVIGISPKILSKELQDLEENLLVARKVICSKPVTVQYSLAEHAAHVTPVMQALTEFGLKHRNRIKLK